MDPRACSAIEVNPAAVRLNPKACSAIESNCSAIEANPLQLQVNLTLGSLQKPAEWQMGFNANSNSLQIVVHYWVEMRLGATSKFQQIRTEFASEAVYTSGTGPKKISASISIVNFSDRQGSNHINVRVFFPPLPSLSKMMRKFVFRNHAAIQLTDYQMCWGRLGLVRKLTIQQF